MGNQFAQIRLLEAARFLKYVWPFYNIMHERVTDIYSDVTGFSFKKNRTKYYHVL